MDWLIGTAIVGGRAGLGRCLALLAILLILGGPATPLRAFTPESPEVKRLIERGIAYLADKTDNRVGGKCLIGMAFLKHLGDVEHPKVQEAVDACVNLCKREAKDIQTDIYSTGIAIIFLCEVDPSRYRAEIEKLLTSLNLRQKVHGGYGYPLTDGNHGPTGDTSMTQYAVLSSWAAARSGVVEVPITHIEKVCNWLLRTQDPSGGFGYQGHDSGVVGRRVEQSSVRHPLCAAGLGSVYICAELLGFVKAVEPEEARLEGLPPAVKLAKDDKANQPVALTDKVDLKALRDAIRLGNGWFAKNYKIDPTPWTHYYMYGLERYQSFKELVDGKTIKEPGWYNDGVRFLRETIRENGCWESNCGPEVDTAFALLFLMRSTKKTIEKTVQLAAEGTLVGGRGLPTSTASVRVRNGQVVVAAPSSAASDLLSALEDPSEEALADLVDSLEQLELSSNPQELREQVARLARIAAGGAPEAKILALRTLGKTRQFDLVPTLIRSVRDPDPRVALEAHIALRTISRKLGGIELSDPASAVQRQETAKAWRDWYLSVRPDAELDE